jgi:P27 family predicted phage terminase small subunit
MSRYPTPAKLAILRGNPGKRRIREEPKPAIAAECPDPLDWLGAYAKQEWARIGPGLHRIGLLTVADVAVFAAYCQSYGHWRVAEELAAGKSRKSGDAKGRVLAQIARTAGGDMVRFAAQMGCTPVARARIGGGIGGQGSDGDGKFAGLLRRNVEGGA